MVVDTVDVVEDGIQIAVAVVESLGLVAAEHAAEHKVAQKMQQHNRAAAFDPSVHAETAVF